MANVKVKTAFGPITFQSKSAAINNLLIRMSKAKSHTYGEVTNLNRVAKATGSHTSHVYEMYDRLLAAGKITDFRGRGLRAI